MVWNGTGKDDQLGQVDRAAGGGQLVELLVDDALDHRLAAGPAGAS